MTEPTLEQVKRFAEQLSPEERGQLWQHLAELPDSGIKTIPFPPLPKPQPERISNATKGKNNKAQNRPDETTFNIRCEIKDDIVTYYADEIGVFSTRFYPDNFANVFLSKPSGSFLKVSPEQRELFYAAVRERLAKEGLKVSNQQLKKVEPAALRELELRLIKESVEHATKQVRENLPPIVKIIWDRVLKASFFSGANELRDKVRVPEQKYSAEKIWESLYQPEWELLKTIARVARGGLRKRKSKFSWSKSRAIEFYRTVQSLPLISKKPLWEYALEQLRQNDYNATTIAWLKSHPAFADIPDNLLKEAATKWRSYEEQSKNIPANFKPLAFAFRHACHKLSYPNQAYNTLRKRYYEGKKASENKQ